MIKKLTPVLAVEAIEPLLPLWEALGFARTVEVPHGERIGFVILQRDSAEVMLQTHASIRADEPRVEESGLGRSALFVEVEDLDALSARVPAGTEVLVERRKTFYGSTEMILRDAAGNVITLAQMAPQ
ncbi:MAG TPA: VOC family protein [Thermoanaerobaculia bacterium]|jgi:uncharacterized glyoxalase superfamily protein PhnB|nr:VOC family protein [Thermoanaerobaculia bacterium]